MILDCEHGPNSLMLGPPTTLMESASNRLCKKHINGLLDIIFQDSGKSPAVPSCTMDDVMVLLLCCTPTMPPSPSPVVVTTYLLHGLTDVLYWMSRHFWATYKVCRHCLILFLEMKALTKCKHDLNISQWGLLYGGCLADCLSFPPDFCSIWSTADKIDLANISQSVPTGLADFTGGWLTWS